jgi:hypothetical protein
MVSPGQGVERQEDKEDLGTSPNPLVIPTSAKFGCRKDTSIIGTGLSCRSANNPHAVANECRDGLQGCSDHHDFQMPTAYICTYFVEQNPSPANTNLRNAVSEETKEK